MSAFAPNPISRGPLIAAGLAMFGALALAAAGRIEHAGLPPARSAVIATRSLHFADGPGNTVIVSDAATGHLIRTFIAGQDNFLRVTMHTLAEHRAHAGIGQKPPFTLTRYADDEFELADPATGRRIDLQAFGPTNEANFAPLLTVRESTR